MLIAGQGRPLAMLSAAASLLSRLAFSETISRRDATSLAIVAILHAAALVIMVMTEVDLVSKSAFLLGWAVLNYFWLGVLAAARDRGAAVARNRRRADPAVAIQV